MPDTIAPPPSDNSESPTALLWPPYLNEYAIHETHMANAYDALGPQERATLKLTISRLHVLWGEQRHVQERTRIFPQGFSLWEKESPMEYALIVCDASYPHASCFLAALMPAILAGVPTILPCLLLPDAPSEANCFPSSESLAFPHKNHTQGAAPFPHNAALLTAIELAGIEQPYALPKATLHALVTHLAPQQKSGCILHVAEGPPVLSFPHTLLNRKATLASHAFSADAAHADTWVWPELAPSQFRTRRMYISTLPQ